MPGPDKQLTIRDTTGCQNQGDRCVHTWHEVLAAFVPSRVVAAVEPSRRLARDPAYFFALLVVGLTQIGLIDALCLAAPTPERALAYVCKLSPLWSPTSVQLVREGDGTSVCCRPFEPTAQSQGHGAGRRLWGCAWSKGGLDDRLSAQRCIQLPSTPEPQLRELRAAFACVIYFDRPVIAVEFRSADLEQPNPNADAALVKLLSRYAEDRLSTLQRVQGTVAQLNRLLGNMEDVADASADVLAAALGIGSRTLHRRLRGKDIVSASRAGLSACVAAWNN